MIPRAFALPGAPRRRLGCAVALPVALMPACGGFDQAALPPPFPAEGETPAAPAAPPGAAPGGQAVASAAPASAIDLEPAAAPPAPAKMPSLAFRSPKPNEAVPKAEAERYLVKLDIADFPLAQGGPHVHLVLDDHPYKPLYDAAAAIRLGDVVPGEPLSEGEHVLVAFPSTADNLAIKPDKGRSPLARVSFWVGKPGKAAGSARAPRVVLNRPKGTYNGASADRILLDFYLIDAELGAGAGAVRATVTPPVGEARALVITRWIPYWITHLPDGDTRVRLELLDANGAPLPGKWSATERIITVNRAATEGQGAAVEAMSARDASDARRASR